MTSSAEGQAKDLRARPLVRLPPIGFWSYSRQDDDLSNGKLSRLRSLLMSELQQQYGRERVQLFQDVSTIPHGAAWEREIRKSLANSNFFIPIISPNFIQSEWCSAEVRLFLQREAHLFKSHPDLPRRSRIFPILLIDAEHIEPYDDEVQRALKKLHWFDFRGFRHKNYDDESVQQAVSHYASSISRLLLVKVRDRAATDEDQERRSAEAAAPQDELAIAQAHGEEEDARTSNVDGFRRETRREGAAPEAWPQRGAKLGGIAGILLKGKGSPFWWLGLAGILMLGILSFALLDRQSNSTLVSPEVPDPRKIAVPSAEQPAVVAANKAPPAEPTHSWVLGRWGVNGDCTVARTISAHGRGIRIEFPGGSQVEAISEATPQRLATNVATYAREARNIRVREPALDLEYELTPCR